MEKTLKALLEKSFFNFCSSAHVLNFSSHFYYIFLLLYVDGLRILAFLKKKGLGAEKIKTTCIGYLSQLLIDLHEIIQNQWKTSKK